MDLDIQAFLNLHPVGQQNAVDGAVVQEKPGLGPVQERPGLGPGPALLRHGSLHRQEGLGIQVPVLGIPVREGDLKMVDVLSLQLFPAKSVFKVRFLVMRIDEGANQISLSDDGADRVAIPRQIAMFLCKKLTGSSLPQIGRGRFLRVTFDLAIPGVDAPGCLAVIGAGDDFPRFSCWWHLAATRRYPYAPDWPDATR